MNITLEFAESIHMMPHYNLTTKDAWVYLGMP